ncbi:DUF917 domain-containing protein [Leifsonia sp. NPDC058248]|uniref:DUF917 domain-containing protein n=1 Tax=Leifsonia sp. NPDC058248 TaxID=3346402 RepID=UPI0036DA4D05
MARTLEHDRLPALARGFSLLGSGGGGTTTMLELMLPDSPAWPIGLHAVGELDPETPCLAAAFAGSTYLLAERIPGESPFAELIDAAERWTGVRARAVCPLEGAGLNGLSPFLLADEFAVVDADFMGRALPRLDQLSLFVDRVPGTVTVCGSGAGGVVLIDTDRADDVESVLRGAIVQAGGASAVVVAGFTVGDLAEHAVEGTFRRALQLGTAFDSATEAPLSELAERLGGRMLGIGRIAAVESSPTDEYVSTIEMMGDDGGLLRVIARSEVLAFMRDGRVEAASPEIIVTIDSISRDILQVDGLTYARHVAVFALPAPGWWTSSPDRMRHVTPAAFGLAGLEPAA